MDTTPYLKTTYWVSWTCEGNGFDAPYDTADERDARISELEADRWVTDVSAWESFER